MDRYRQSFKIGKEEDMSNILRKHFQLAFILLTLLSLSLTACSLNTPAPTTSQKSGNPTVTQVNFPQTAPVLRTPTFGVAGQVAPTVKVLPSVDPTLIIQFPLFPSGIKAKFPQATGLVTVFQDTQANDFDAVTVDVLHMPPDVKFTFFFTEISAKPFGHAEYVGDVITREDGTGESTFHLITLVAFAADNRHPVTSNDQSGSASGIQLEHVGMWFDGNDSARQVLQDPTLAGTPFDGGDIPKHAGPQAMTDGQSLAVI
jgi:hypothetical protein